MQTKLLTDVVVEIAGKSASDILQLLIGKKDVNEFLIAKKLKLTINQVRNILYKMSNHSLVKFTRKKDKKKGWYTYFWTLDNEKVLELLEKRLTKEIDAINFQLRSRRTKIFYECKGCKTEISEEKALLHDFTCMECDEVYVLKDNKKIISSMENELTKLEKQREEVKEELAKIVQVQDKKRNSAAKREERKKKKKRAAKRAERKKEREKEKKKEERKSKKKKIKKKAKKKTKKKVKKKKVKKSKKIKKKKK